MDIDPTKILVRYNVKKEVSQTPEQMAAEMFPRVEPARTIAKGILMVKRTTSLRALKKQSRMEQIPLSSLTMY